MVLSEKQIEDFQKLYQERFGKEISREDALKQGAKLLRLISILYRPKKEGQLLITK